MVSDLPCGSASCKAVKPRHRSCKGSLSSSNALYMLAHIVSPPTCGQRTMLRMAKIEGSAWKVRSLCHSSAIPPRVAASSKISGASIKGFAKFGCPSSSPKCRAKATWVLGSRDCSGKKRTKCSMRSALISSADVSFTSPSLMPVISAPNEPASCTTSMPLSSFCRRGILCRFGSFVQAGRLPRRCVAHLATEDTNRPSRNLVCRRVDSGSIASRAPHSPLCCTTREKSCAPRFAANTTRTGVAQCP